MPAFFRVLYGAFVLTVAGPLSLDVAAEAPPPGREEAVARLQRDLPIWRDNLPASRPRTFFTPEQWTALPKRWDGASAHERRWLDAALARASEVAFEPAPTYRTAEETVAATGATIFAARAENWMRPVGDKMVLLSFALAVRDEPLFREALRSLVLTACTYPTWGAPQNEGDPFPNGDLAAAHVSRGVAIAYDWHPELWSEAEKTLIRETVRERMAGMLSAAYGGLWWSDNYQDNHNHVDASSLGICGLAFLDEIPEAAEWLAHAANNFERVAIETNADGSSPEGVPYWSYSMSFLLQYIEATRPVLTTGKLYDAPFFRSSARYRLASSTPGFAGTLPWGDSPTRDYYGPHHLLYRLAAEYRDAGAQYVADNLPFAPRGPSGAGDNESNDIAAWISLWHDPSVGPVAPRELDYHLPAGDLVTTRSGWGANDYLLAIKSGFNNRSHGHLDAGALAFAFGGKWLITTPGYGKGQGNAAFWDSNGTRWEYSSNSTESHSTLLIDGKNQSFDRQNGRGRITDFVTTSDWCWTDIDLTAAYTGIDHVRRKVLHRRRGYVLVLDEVKDEESHRVEWLAQMPPEAVASGSTLNARADAGSLNIAMLSPSSPFYARSLSQPRVDVPPERLRTWAVANEGRTTAFAALLVPRFSGAPEPKIMADFATRSGRRHFTIRGMGWTDTIIAGDETASLVTEGYSARAQTLMLRRGGQGVASLLALQADRLATSDFELQSVELGSLGMSKITDDVWIAYSPADRAVRLAAAAEWTLEPWPVEAGESAGASFVVYRGDRASMLRDLPSVRSKQSQHVDLPSP